MAFTRFTILSLIIMLNSPSAGAINLTGTWNGKFTCTGFDGVNFSFVQPDRGQPTQILKISQPQGGNRLTVQWFDGDTLASTFTGFVIDSINRPDTRGHAAIADCGTKADITSGISEIADLNASLNPSKGRGSLTGKSIFTDPDNPNNRPEVTHCRWTFKLVNPAEPDPAVPAGCPQQPGS